MELSDLISSIDGQIREFIEYDTREPTLSEFERWLDEMVNEMYQMEDRSPIIQIKYELYMKSIALVKSYRRNHREFR